MNRIQAFAGDLGPGDVLRDSGAERTILKVEPVAGAVAEVLVHFKHDPARPDAQSTLSMAAAQPVTAWRVT